MLVTLTSSSSGEIIMFADVAQRLFAIAGKECTARGVFTKVQLPNAIEKLRQAVIAEKDSRRQNASHAEEDDNDESGSAPDISLAQRAHPLIELLDSTRKEDGFIMWHAAHDFSPNSPEIRDIIRRT